MAASTRPGGWTPTRRDLFTKPDHAPLKGVCLVPDTAKLRWYTDEELAAGRAEMMAMLNDAEQISRRMISELGARGASVYPTPHRWRVDAEIRKVIGRFDEEQKRRADAPLTDGYAVTWTRLISEGLLTFSEAIAQRMLPRDLPLREVPLYRKGGEPVAMQEDLIGYGYDEMRSWKRYPIRTLRDLDDAAARGMTMSASVYVRGPLSGWKNLNLTEVYIDRSTLAERLLAKAVAVAA